VNDIQSSTQPSLSQPKLLRLSDPACEDPALVGSKTATLAPGLRRVPVLPVLSDGRAALGEVAWL
jgi:hypothetical protein